MIAETFIQGKGFLYRFDSRPKFLILIVITITMLFEDNYYFQFIFYCLLFFLTFTTLGFRGALKPIISIFPVLLLTAILTPLFNNEGEIVLSAGSNIFITDQGIIITILLLLRFLIITTVFFLFFSTTKTSSFILALRAFGLPFKASLTVTIALRYIPDMYSTYHRISDAHKLRTAGTGLGQNKTLRIKLGRIFPVLISVLIHAVKNIPDLAMALDSKGFERQNKRTSCEKLPPWKNIFLHIFFSILFISLIIFLAVLI